MSDMETTQNPPNAINANQINLKKNGNYFASPRKLDPVYLSQQATSESTRKRHQRYRECSIDRRTDINGLFSPQTKHPRYSLRLEASLILPQPTSHN